MFNFHTRRYLTRWACALSGVVLLCPVRAHATATGFALDALPSSHRLRTVPHTDLVRLAGAARDALRVDLYVNDRYIGNERVLFDSARSPCLARDVLVRAGVDDHALERVAHATQNPGSGSGSGANANANATIDVTPRPACVPIAKLSPDAKTTLDAAELRLDVSIPQMQMRAASTDAGDRSRWDPGIPALFSNYTIDVIASRDSGRVRHGALVELVNGINVGYWHWRQLARVKLEPPVLARRFGYRATRTYADRPIPEWDALLRVGEIDTDSFVDRPIPMLGVSIASDERMLADTVRGYAPIIRGVAPARSTVIVKQQGRTILDTIVPAGPFALTDLRPVASRGDLDVVVIANGREVQHDHIPSATLPRMVREGAHRFAMSAGRAIRGRTRPFLVSTSMRYGLTNRTTLQAGTQWTRGFANAGAGFASNTFAGAWAVDLDTALSRSSRSHYDTSALWRLGFASASASARSAWSASASWRTGRGRIDLSEWLATRSSRRARGATTNGIATGTREVRLSTMLSYAWPSRVASHASASLRRARDSSCASCAMSGMSAELGIATQFGAAAVSLGIAHSREFGHPLRQTRISIDVRAPLSSEPRSPHIASRIDMDDAQHLSQRWTLSGFANPIHATFDGAAIANTANDDHDEANTLHASDASDASPLTYAISVSCRTRDAQPLFAPGLVRLHQALDACVRIPAAASIDLAYRDRLGETFASLSGTRTVSIRREGALVVHRGGLTWGSAAGMAGRGTFALLDTAGVGGIPLIGMADVRSDSHGFALIPSLRPYRSNAIEVDVARAPRGVALTATTRDVVPLPGAIVRVQLGAKYLQRQRIRIALADGSAPPRGARIVDARGQSVAPIGRRGRVRAAFETNMHWLADAGRRPLRVVSDNRPVCALNDDAVHAASLATPADTRASPPLEVVLICQ